MDLATLFRNAFGRAPEVQASAPGRVEIIGNHLDYNGGLTVGACLEQRVVVAAAKRTDGAINLTTRRSSQREAAFEGSGQTGFSELVTTTIENYRTDELPDWTRYPLGVLDELRMMGGALSHGDAPGGAMSRAAENGFDLAIKSDLPEGAGLSSSAALEVAVALALDNVLETGLDARDIAGLCHRAENRYVGVPCGLLDQMVVATGKSGHFVVFDAASAETTQLPLPTSTRIIIIQSHVTRSLASSPYEQRRKECLGALMGLQRVIPGIRHLAHLHPIDVETYGGILPGALARRAGHAAQENERSKRFVRHIENGELDKAGALLFESHQSSRTLFDNSIPELDFIVDHLREAPGVLGARLTGAGWGGAVVAWVSDGFTAATTDHLAQTYEETFEATIRVIDSAVAGGAEVWSSAGSNGGSANSGSAGSNGGSANSGSAGSTGGSANSGSAGSNGGSANSGSAGGSRNVGAAGGTRITEGAGADG